MPRHAEGKPSILDGALRTVSHERENDKRSMRLLATDDALPSLNEYLRAFTRPTKTANHGCYSAWRYPRTARRMLNDLESATPSR